MVSHNFKDPAVEELTRKILLYDSSSLNKALIKQFENSAPFGADESVYALELAMFLNTTYELFGRSDSFFHRGNIAANQSSVLDIVNHITNSIKPDSKLAGAGLTSSKRLDDVMRAIEDVSRLSHIQKLAADEYDRLTILQDGLSLEYMKDYLPQEYVKDLPRMQDYVESQLKTNLDNKLTLLGIRRLIHVINNKLYQREEYLSPNPSFIKKYQSLTLTIDNYFYYTIDKLYDFPPLLTYLGPGTYSMFLQDQLLVWLKKKELDYLETIKRKHSNVTGDSLEDVLADFLVKKMLTVGNNPSTCLQIADVVLPSHFQFSKPSIERKRTPQRQPLFDAIGFPNKPKIEIDLIANHSDGFSIIGEVKYCGSYNNADDYYYVGSANKGAEKDRLLALAAFFNKNPSFKSDFLIETSNVVIPVFITNTVGELFEKDDGVVKATPFEVMRVEPFYRLVRAKYDDIVANSHSNSTP